MDDAGHIGVVLFAPVDEIYDRYKLDFYDDAAYKAKRVCSSSFLPLLIFFLFLPFASPRVFSFFLRSTVSL